MFKNLDKFVIDLVVRWLNAKFELDRDRPDKSAKSVTVCHDHSAKPPDYRNLGTIYSFERQEWDETFPLCQNDSK